MPKIEELLKEADTTLYRKLEKYGLGANDSD